VETAQQIGSKWMSDFSEVNSLKFNRDEQRWIDEQIYPNPIIYI